MKTAELTGTTLDYWVAFSEGLTNPRITIYGCLYDRAGTERFHPSENWEQGGPIIEARHINLTCLEHWRAFSRGREAHGQTPLLAAMRLVVLLFMGWEVPDEPWPQKTTEPEKPAQAQPDKEDGSDEPEVVARFGDEGAAP